MAFNKSLLCFFTLIAIALSLPQNYPGQSPQFGYNPFQNYAGYQGQPGDFSNFGPSYPNSVASGYPQFGQYNQYPGYYNPSDYQQQYYQGSEQSMGNENQA